MRQTELIKTMGVKEILEWMAYDMASDDKFRQKFYHDQEVERQKTLDAEEAAELMRKLFRGLNGKR